MAGPVHAPGVGSVVKLTRRTPPAATAAYAPAHDTRPRDQSTAAAIGRTEGSQSGCASATTAVKTPATIHRATPSRSASCASSHARADDATNAVRYPPPAFIDQAAHAGWTMSAAAIRKPVAAPTRFASARNRNSTPTVHSASIAAFNDSGLTPNARKLIAAGTVSTGSNA